MLERVLEDVGENREMTGDGRVREEFKGIGDVGEGEIRGS